MHCVVLHCTVLYRVVLYCIVVLYYSLARGVLLHEALILKMSCFPADSSAHIVDICFKGDRFFCLRLYFYHYG